MSPLTPDTPHTGWLAWIYQLPIPQTKIVLGVICTLGTFVWAWASKDVSEGTLLALLGFCATLFGIAHYDFKTKRTTDLDYQQGEVQKIEAAKPEQPIL